MKKIFTLATAILASFSLWATEETFTFEWTEAGTKGYSYEQAGPASGSMLTDNALYFVSNEGPKVEGSNLNPYRVGFIFKPAVDVTLKIKGAAGSSDRTLQNIKIDKEIDARFYNLCKDAVGSSATVMQYALDNASDEDKEFYTTVGILKKSKEVYSVAGDAKSVSGQTAQAKLYAERVDANNIKFPKNDEAEEMLMSGNPAEDFTFEAGKCYRIYTEVSSSTGAKLLSFTFITSVPPCTAPAEKLTLSADKTEDVYVGDVITFTTAGGNGSEIKIYDGEEEISSPWTATAGAHSFTAVQEANDGVCGAITEAIEINVASKNPVTSAVINGPTAAEAGDELTYTLEADNATVIAWYLDGELQEETSATFVYTAVIGKHAIYATASNAYTDEPVKSNEIALVVSAALVNDTYIWKKGSGYTGCVENPNVDPNANQAETVLANSRCDISGASKMGRAETDNVEVSIQFTANEGLYIQEICTYGKLEEPAGAEISWDGNKWEHIDAYTETQKSFEAPASTYPTLFIIKFLGVSHSSGGIWWRNALLTLSTKPEGTGFESTEATIKATKVIRNGQMFILKNGVLYNMQGAVVK